jgi:hypothetical protein
MDIANTFRTFIFALCVALLLIGFFVLVLYTCRDKFVQLFKEIKAHPIASLFFLIPLTVLFVYGSTKQVTPTVKGITLGSPMETPTSVELAWTPDDGTEIQSNQLVRVYWRDAYNPKWHLATEGYGITNATVTGFYISADTDWIVEVEGLTNKVEEVVK